MAMHKNSARARILGLLELEDGGWLTSAQLHSEYMLRYGPVSMDTLSRALHRMAKSYGEVELGIAETGYTLESPLPINELKVRLI
jgi:hypothetical protein